MTKPLRALVADDDDGIRQLLRAVLKREGFEVCLAENGRQAVDLYRAQAFDIVLMDIRMPLMTGMEALTEIRAFDPRATIILMTAFAAVETAVSAIKQGAFDYVIKPFDIDEMLLLVRRALELDRMRADIAALQRELSESWRLDLILTNSPKMIELCQSVTRVAKSTASVLITGESGSGKELLATAIHYGSPRRNGPFVRINCGAIPEGLLESEFFGHEKGAFTGAVARRLGRFEQADGGTLFLDEIGDISPSLQVKLLRVLQERQFERVGGNQTLSVDVRIIGATNRNLEELVRQGRFRQDLYFRLNVVHLKTIPLRDRPEDIRLLAGYFLQKYAADNKAEIGGFDDRAMECLLAYGWPGNVRELANAVERAVVMGTGRTILPEDLPETVCPPRDAAQDIETETETEDDEQNPSPPIATAGHSLRDLVNDYEARVIAEALARNGGNRVRTARDLGVSRRSLLYKIQEYAID